MDLHLYHTTDFFQEDWISPLQRLPAYNDLIDIQYALAGEGFNLLAFNVTAVQRMGYGFTIELRSGKRIDDVFIQMWRHWRPSPGWEVDALTAPAPQRATNSEYPQKSAGDS